MEAMDLTDAQLVERAQRGDADAFESLVRRHLRSAYATALAVVHEPADADDVCQDAFINALERIEDCRQPDRFAAWLRQIVRNQAHSLHRYQSVRQARPLESITAEAGTSYDPEIDAERSELRARLKAEIRKLSEVQREVLLLYDLEGWRHREIAELLDMPVGTVRSHLSHARRTLRKRLGTELYMEL